MANWFVRHLDHSGNVLDEFEPEALDFTWNLGQQGPHTVQYELSMQHAELHHGRWLNKLGPYFTDFELFRDNRKIMAGMHVALSQGNVEDDAVTIGGKDYLHYLEKRHYPSYSYDDLYIDLIETELDLPPAPRIWVEQDISTVVSEMLTETRDIDSYSLDFSVDVPTFGQTIPYYRIDMGDTEMLLSKIQTMSRAWYDLGFDFEMTPAKVFKLYPREYDPSFSPIWGTLPNGNGDPNPPGFVDVGFTNQGVEGTHAMGIGSGIAVKGIANSHYRNNSAFYRRIDMIADVGDYGPDPHGDPIKMLKALTNSAISVGANPFKEVELTLKPEEIGNFWKTESPGFWPGRYIYLDHDLIWHHLDSLFKITSVRVQVDNERDELATIGLNQKVEFNIVDGYPDP